MGTPFMHYVTFMTEIKQIVLIRMASAIFFALLFFGAGLPGTGLLVQEAEAQSVERFKQFGWETDFSKSNVDLTSIEVNLPRDGIRSIDNPKFVSQADAARWLGDREPVLSLEINGEARAYPLQILTWHEIVNDNFGDTPVAVTFCPLCYSAIAFDRRIDGKVHEIGVSGMLRHSDMVMYDRTTQSLFQQITGEAIAGEYTGKVLEKYPAQIISFEQFREAHPGGSVLSKDTGMDRQYGRNPYPGYDDIDERPWLFDGRQDGRLPPMEKVIGLTLSGGEVKAYPHSLTRKKNVIHDMVGDTPVVVFHTKKGAASALDKGRIAGSKDIGSTGVFSPAVDGEALEFTFDNGQFKDARTASTWNIAGMAVDGPLKGTQLERLTHADVFSFAWFVLYPDTELYND